ncbi:DUF1631 domain-containing protein [Marinobacter piscensis]|uniref:DUF1631 domain-containing protein n=1 Tax=Marinobacter piscensis TaxID=1562308 RepID=UPI0011AA0FD2|nr:DUF1631 domain-containing protein [Marinobacter piscensis]
MSKQSDIHYLHQTRKAGGNTPVPPEVSRIRDTVVAGLGDLLQGAFDAVDDSLFELANNARSNNEQNRYFEAMREIRIKRKGVERQFQHRVAQLFATPPGTDTPSVTQAHATQDNLTLVGNDDLEEQVALTAMATKARAHFQGPLLQLQTRFTQVYDGRSEDSPVNPMAPEHLCKAFADAIAPLEIQIRERLILLKQFDRYVVSNLEMLLDEANRILIQAGVIPNFRYHGKSEPGHTTRTENTTGEPQNSTVDDSEVLDQIYQLLARQRGDSGTRSRQHDPGIRVVGINELFSLLTQLPASRTSETTRDLSEGEPLTVDLRNAVQNTLSQASTRDGKKPALKEVDEDLVNLVSMLFEFILEDYNLSAPIQVLISRLQIPILKVVLKDRSFFSKASHPARKLLNSLARAGIGWSNSDEKARDKLYEKIHSIVQTILNEFDGDIGLFVELNTEFEAFLARENRKASLVEQRTRESERGRIKSQRAQEIVDQVIAERLARYTLPESVYNMLINGWSRVMFLAYLRDDKEHRWQESVNVVDDLIWCLHPHLEDAERDQWVRVVPGLLKALRTGLEEVSYNSVRLDETMSQLKQELAEAFRASSGMEMTQAPPPAPEASPDEARQQAELHPEDASIADFMVQVDELETGNWVEFRLVNGTGFRCKLSAVIEEADCFVFVNRMGLKVIEKTRTELALEMQRGRMKRLEQGALIDRALGAVVGSLRSKTA